MNTIDTDFILDTGIPTVPMSRLSLLLMVDRCMLVIQMNMKAEEDFVVVAMETRKVTTESTQETIT